MGFFTKADDAVAAMGGNTAPVTLDRVEQMIRDQDYEVAREDEYLWAHWDGRYFDFRVFGEGRVFQVRGIWNGSPTMADREALGSATNAWNSDKLFPKVFVVTDSDGAPLVVAEVNAPVGPGLTDEQLSDLLNAGLVTGEEFFATLDAEFPHAAPPPRPDEPADDAAEPAADDAAEPAPEPGADGESH